MDPDTARTRLLTERERLMRLREEEVSILREATGTDWLSGEEQDPGDEANEIFELQREHSVTESLEAELALVDEALERVDAGTYGQCVICGRSIGDERLAARPMARYCIEHQRQIENEVRARGFEGADPTI